MAMADPPLLLNRRPKKGGGRNIARAILQKLPMLDSKKKKKKEKKKEKEKGGDQSRYANVNRVANTYNT